MADEAALSGGKCNTGIARREVDGRRMVVRGYCQDTISANELQWAVGHLREVGLVAEGDWTHATLADGSIEVGNPEAHIVDEGLLPKAVVWAAYEELLEKLKALWSKERLIVTDAHSLNIQLCAIGESQYRFLVLDGKAAGVSDWPSTYRLQIKLKCERRDNHKWFLHSYIKYLHGQGVAAE